MLQLGPFCRASLCSIKYVVVKTPVENQQSVTQIKRPHYRVWVIYLQVGNQWVSVTWFLVTCKDCDFRRVFQCLRHLLTGGQVFPPIIPTQVQCVQQCGCIMISGSFALVVSIDYIEFHNRDSDYGHGHWTH